jgi:hypothetical protein
MFLTRPTDEPSGVSAGHITPHCSALVRRTARTHIQMHLSVVKLTRRSHFAITADRSVGPPEIAQRGCECEPRENLRDSSLLRQARGGVLAHCPITRGESTRYVFRDLLVVDE